MFTDWPSLLKMQRTNINVFVPGTHLTSSFLTVFASTDVHVHLLWELGSILFTRCAVFLLVYFMLLFCFVLVINYNGWFAKELLIKILHHFYFAFCVCVQQPDSTTFVFSFTFLLKCYLTFVPVFCYFSLSILIFIDCLLFTFKKKSRSWAKGLQWCGIFLKDYWTALIKARLLFTQCGLCQWCCYVFNSIDEHF